MKLIFLDFDGVLNNEEFYEERIKKWAKKEFVPQHPLSEFDPKCIAYVDKLVEETGAKVVVSSSWRLGRGEMELKKLLKDAGMICELVGMTPFVHGAIRGVEIQDFLNAVPDDIEITHYVIIDDDVDMMPFQMKNFVRVDPKTGFDKDCYNRALKILNKK